MCFFSFNPPLYQKLSLFMFSTFLRGNPGKRRGSVSQKKKQRGKQLVSYSSRTQRNPGQGSDRHELYKCHLSTESDLSGRTRKALVRPFVTALSLIHRILLPTFNELRLIIWFYVMLF